MKQAKSSPVLDRLVSSLADCLTPESTRRILALKADRELQAYVDGLAVRHNEGKLSPKEVSEYGSIVSFSAFVATLQSKARQVLSAEKD